MAAITLATHPPDPPAAPADGPGGGAGGDPGGREAGGPPASPPRPPLPSPPLLTTGALSFRNNFAINKSARDMPDRWLANTYKSLHECCCAVLCIYDFSSSNQSRMRIRIVLACMLACLDYWCAHVHSGVSQSRCGCEAEGRRLTGSSSARHQRLRLSSLMPHSKWMHVSCGNCHCPIPPEHLAHIVIWNADLI